LNRVLFYCQSSLGIGHTIRSLRIAEGLSRRFRVHFIHGGELIPELPVPTGIRMVQVPAISSDAEFTTLTPADPALSLEQAFARRRTVMLETLERVAPDAVVVELYPFGRRQFGPELEPLLTSARDRGARVVCSLRDILVARSDQAAYEHKVAKLMNRYFDLLLVHSDPEFQSLRESFSALDTLRAHVIYTGYVVPAVESNHQGPEDTIIASIGGGRFGHELAEAVVCAAPLLAERIPHRIELYTGPFCPDDVADRLQALATGMKNIRVARFTPDLHQRLARAALSISMGGYNTTMNVLATGVRALMLGCGNNGGMDQVERVEKLGRLGVVDVLRADDLIPAVFAEKVITCLDRTPVRAAIDLDGVLNTTRALQAFLDSTASGKINKASVHG
jgi:predicted glycosyltransferase